MLMLFRGGLVVWILNEDVVDYGINDNDWLEVYNRNGVVIVRVVIFYCMFRGIMFMYYV